MKISVNNAEVGVPRSRHYFSSGIRNCG